MLLLLVLLEMLGMLMRMLRLRQRGNRICLRICIEALLWLPLYLPRGQRLLSKWLKRRCPGML